MSSDRAIQDLYPDDFAYCYGCGRHNAHGLHVRSHWDGEQASATFTPEPHHCAVPGFVYGGLIASLIDCHAMATAAAAAQQAAGETVGVAAAPRFVTGALHVDYLRPTPLGPPLELSARPRTIGERKVVVDVTLSAGGAVTARGEVVAVRIPSAMAAAVVASSSDRNK